jgi:hypothetical protein
MSMSNVKIKLSKPLKAHGETVNDLDFREPVTKDVIELGLPTLIIPGADGESTGIEVRTKVVARYISRLAAIPMGSVEALSLHDYSACTGAVMGFFGTGDGETAAS